MPRQPDKILAEASVRNTRLLSLKELTQLFPEATVHREKVGPFTKSFVAVHLDAKLDSHQGIDLENSSLSTSTINRGLCFK